MITRRSNREENTRWHIGLLNSNRYRNRINFCS